MSLTKTAIGQTKRHQLRLLCLVLGIVATRASLVRRDCQILQDCDNCIQNPHCAWCKKIEGFKQVLWDLSNYAKFTCKFNKYFDIGTNQFSALTGFHERVRCSVIVHLDNTNAYYYDLKCPSSLSQCKYQNSHFGIFS